MSTDSDDVVSIPGSTLRAFIEAFIYMFGVGGILIFGLLEIHHDPVIQGTALYPWLAGYAGLSALLARFISFQGSTLVVLSSEGIRAEWRGPFGGHEIQRSRWVDLKAVRSVRYGHICTVTFKDMPLSMVLVNHAQARAILRDPRCPIKSVPPKLAKRLGLLSKG